MSLFQRIRPPFGEPAEDDSDRLARRNEAGELLRERRQQLRLDLDAVAEALCIKPVYLAAIEQGRTEELPGPTYAIGFIRAYANYLGLDGGRILDLYREEKADVQTRPDLTLPVPLEKRSVPGGRVLMTGLVVALCGYAAWYYATTGERERPERVAAVPAELQVLTTPPPSVQGAATPAAAIETSPVQAGAPAPGAVMASPVPPSAPQARPAPAGASAARTVAAPQFGSGVLPQQQSQQQSAAGPVAPAGGAGEPLPSGAIPAPGEAAPAGGQPQPVAASTSANPSGSIDIRARADCWIQIRDGDQGILFARVLKAGETYRVPRAGLILRTGNAGALDVLVNGKPAPSIGTVGTLRRDVQLEPEALRAGTAVRG